MKTIIEKLFDEIEENGFLHLSKQELINLFDDELLQSDEVKKE